MLRSRLLFACFAAVLAAAVATSQMHGQSQTPGQSLSPRGHISYLPMRGASSAQAATAAAASSPAIPYNGGAVLPNPTTYAFWWGPPSDFPPDAVTGIDEFLEGLDGSTYLAVANEYMLGQTAHTHFGGNWFDDSAPTSDPFGLNAQGNFLITPAICKAINDNGLRPDPTAIYAVYPSNAPNQGYCASHGWDNCADGTVIHFTYVPNHAHDLSVCDTNADPMFTPNKQSEATRAMADSTAHEFIESVTDPNFDGWVDLLAGNELADLCNFNFQTWVPLTNSRWKIQEIWSDQANGCVQGSGRDARVSGAVSHSGTIGAFDIPAAANGTFTQTANILGAVAGYYTDATDEFHAFVRNNLGNVTTIDPPGTGPGSYGGAQALGINDLGAITGNYGDTNFVIHGFVRDHQGNYVTFDPPGSALTLPQGINNQGVIAGNLFDASSVSHGFVRDSLGNFVTFDAPGAANGLYGGTIVLSINGNGAVTGNYLDANDVTHGFVRHADGTIVTFDAPGTMQGTFPQSINVSGAVAGYYTDVSFVNHGFVRDALGKFITFDDPHAATGGTFAFSINALGAVAGYYSDANGFPHGFVRDVHGNFQTLSDSSPNYGNVVRSLNDLGLTAGYVTRAVN